MTLETEVPTRAELAKELAKVKKPVQKGTVQSRKLRNAVRKTTVVEFLNLKFSGLDIKSKEKILSDLPSYADEWEVEDDFVETEP